MKNKIDAKQAAALSEEAIDKESLMNDVYDKITVAAKTGLRSCKIQNDVSKLKPLEIEFIRDALVRDGFKVEYKTKSHVRDVYLPTRNFYITTATSEMWVSW